MTAYVTGAAGGIMRDRPEPIIGCTDLYADGGCMFGNPTSTGLTWAVRYLRRRAGAHNAEDGAVLSQRSGVYLCTPSHPKLTSNVAEFLAVVEGLELLPDGWAGAVYSDSELTIARFTAGAALNGVPARLIKRGAAALKRIDRQRVVFVKLAGHPTITQLAAGVGKGGRPVSLHHVWCDDAAKAAGDRYREANGLPVPYGRTQ